MTPTDPKSLIAEGERLLAAVIQYAPNPADSTRLHAAVGQRDEWLRSNAADLLALAKDGLAAQERPDNARVAELRHQAKHAVMVGASMLGEALADADEQRKRADTLEAALGVLAGQLGAIKREGRAEAFEEAAKLMLDTDPCETDLGATWCNEDRSKVLRDLAAKEREA